MTDAKQIADGPFWLCWFDSQSFSFDVVTEDDVIDPIVDAEFHTAADAYESAIFTLLDYRENINAALKKARLGLKNSRKILENENDVA